MANGEDADCVQGDTVEDTEALVLDLPDLLTAHLGDDSSLLREVRQAVDPCEQAV